MMCCVSFDTSAICFHLKNGEEICLYKEDMIIKDYSFTIINKEKLNSLKQ